MTRPKRSLALAAVVLGAAAGGGGAWAATHGHAAAHVKQAPKQHKAPARQHDSNECPFHHSTADTADL